MLCRESIVASFAFDEGLAQKVSVSNLLMLLHLLLCQIYSFRKTYIVWPEVVGRMIEICCQ